MSDYESLQQSIAEIHEDPMNRELYLARGIQWYECKCYDECASDLLFYEALGGTDPLYMKCLGMALQMTTSKRATDYMKKYLSIDKDDIDAMAWLAETFYQSGDYESSAIYYAKAVEKGYDPGIMRAKAAELAGSKMYDEAARFDLSFKKKSLFRR